MTDIKSILLFVLALIGIFLFGFLINLFMHLFIYPDVSDSIAKQYDEHPFQSYWRYGGFYAKWVAKLAYRIRWGSEKNTKPMDMPAWAFGEDGDKASNILANGGWICSSCGKLNRSHVETCSCGGGKK